MSRTHSACAIVPLRNISKMFHVNRKFVVAYALFVILPAIVLVGILNSGRKLRATVSVGGWWQLQAIAGLAELGCVDPKSVEGGLVQVVQSGKTLDFRLATGLTVGTGVIEGKMIRLSVVAPRSIKKSECSGIHDSALILQLDPQNAPGVAKGYISIPGCGLCKPLEVQMVRQAKALEKREN